jgi:hypothetical protein
MSKKVDKIVYLCKRCWRPYSKHPNSKCDGFISRKEAHED